MAHPLRASRRSGRRGVTLVETLIVLTFLGIVGSLATLAVSASARAKAKAALGFAPPPTPTPLSPAQRAAARAAFERQKSEQFALALRRLALHWLERRAESACPDVALLAEEAHGSAAHYAHDLWGNAFELACEGNEVIVSSAGPDHERGTGDDITASAALEVSRQAAIKPPSFAAELYQ